MTIVKFTYNTGRPGVVSIAQKRVLVRNGRELEKNFPDHGRYWHSAIKRFILKYGPLLIASNGGWMGLCHVNELERREVN